VSSTPTLLDSAQLRRLHFSPTRRSSDLVGNGPGRPKRGRWSSAELAAGRRGSSRRASGPCPHPAVEEGHISRLWPPVCLPAVGRSEEHTSELQSRENIVCRLLLEKKKEE